jgi:hypothetical protein
MHVDVGINIKITFLNITEIDGFEHGHDRYGLVLAWISEPAFERWRFFVLNSLVQRGVPAS